MATGVAANATTPPCAESKSTLVWEEFVATRLLTNYRDEEDILVQRMRRAIEVLREEIDADYPLAHGFSTFRESRRAIAVDLARFASTSMSTSRTSVLA